MLFSNFSLVEILCLIPAILFSLSFHELSHAYISYKLGDPTAKNLGRLTLNPIKHLDVLGTIMILVSYFGWAKPVPINPMYYRDKKKGTLLVSIAGPLSNILLGFIAAFPIIYLESKFSGQQVSAIGFYKYHEIIYKFLLYFYTINLNLAIFNLIPVPPLDGSKILSAILPTRQYFKLMQYENYIGIVFYFICFCQCAFQCL